MYTSVSQEFLNVVNRPSRHFAARFIKTGGTALADSAGRIIVVGDSMNPLVAKDGAIQFFIYNIICTTGTCGSDSLSVGCAFASYIEVTATYSAESLEGEELQLELGLLLDGGSYEWIPFGMWTVQKPSKENDRMVFQAVDRIASKMSGDYSTSLTYPATIADVLSELSASTGVTIHCSLQTSITIDSPIENTTNRGALATIAGILLGNAWCDRNGEVRITALNTSNEAALNYDYVKTQPVMDETDTEISGVRVYVVEDSADVYIEDGVPHMLETTCELMTQDILETVSSNIIGLEYNGGNVSFMGNPLLDPSDCIVFTVGSGSESENAETYVIPCMEIIQSFDGGLLTTVTAPGSFEITNSTVYTGAITAAIERQQRRATEAQETAEEALEAVNQAAIDFAEEVARINDDLDDLQSQIDGSIDTWFYDVDPTLSNLPASEWTTDDLKQAHIGDLYYNVTTQYCWRWQYYNGVYSWAQLSDTGVTEALARAAEAQDTADSKRRVFVTTPTPPYDVGDLWTQGATGDILRCQTGKTSGNYDSADWALASKYTDDTIAEEAKSTAENALSLADGKSTVYFGGTAPSDPVEGDAWFDFTHGNALYGYDGTRWVIRQFGQGSLVAGSVTANEINVNSLSAISANIGEVTSGIIRSLDYSYTAGNRYTNDGMIIDLNNQIIRTEHVAIVGGSLYATNADLSGKMTATSGSIGGFEIDSTSIHTAGIAVTSNALNSIALSSVNFTRTIDGIERNGLRLAIADKFAVDNSGILYASTAVIKGTVYALQGEIGGFVIDSTSIHTNGVVITSNADSSIGLSSADFTRTIGDLSVSNLRFAIADSFGITKAGVLYAKEAHFSDRILMYNQSFASESDYDLLSLQYVHAQAKPAPHRQGTPVPVGRVDYALQLSGAVHCTALSASHVNVDDIGVLGAITAEGDITSYANISADGNLTVGGAFSSPGTVISLGSVGSISVPDTTYRRVRIFNASGEGSFRISSTGALGIYSETQDNWVIYMDGSNGNIYLPLGIVCAGGSSVKKNVRFSVTNNYGSYDITANTDGDFFIRDASASVNVMKYEKSSGNDYIRFPHIVVSKGLHPTDDAQRPVVTCSNVSKRQIGYILTAGDDSTVSNRNNLKINGQFGNSTSFTTRYIETTSSDIRLKENVRDCTVESALALINEIKVRSFDWKDSRWHQKIGFVADELELLDSDLAVGGGLDESGGMNVKSVNTFYLIGYIVKALQELSCEVNRMKGGVANGI